MTALTIAERIMLHLSRYELADESEFNINWDLTQDGIASSLRISRAHGSIELKKLKESGKIDERHGHVKGGKARKKSYHLTPVGMDQAKRIKVYAEKEGIDIMPLLDLKRCDPCKLWSSVDEEHRDALGLACVLRCSVPRTDLPDAPKNVIPSDMNGMTSLSDVVKKNVLGVADPERIRGWHSTAADLWLDKNNVRERLYHLICAERVKDACRLIMNEKETLLNDVDDDISSVLSKLNDIPERYFIDVISVKITGAVKACDTVSAKTMIALLKEKNEELGLLYSADLEMRKGNNLDALDIIRGMKITNTFETDIRAACALGRLGKQKEATDILMRMKERMIASGTVDGLDRVYMQMADVAAASGDHDSSIRYLTKALSVTTESGRRKVYGLLSISYDATGMKEKAAECFARSH
ncbi:MAG: tetratricopeptide repeat protein [Methanomassiliicoccaceae archaeon]|nr:tetratricopeptide repeat protein [Methanomassiliicoccaceae archaeon]